MRTSVLDTLVEALHRNLSRGFFDLALFEMGLVTRGQDAVPVTLPSAADRPTNAELAALEAGIPRQPRHVAGLMTGSTSPLGVLNVPRAYDWADAVEAVRRIAITAGTQVSVANGENAPWHPGRCAQISVPGGIVIGWAGELHPKVIETLALPAKTVAFEVNVDLIVAVSNQLKQAPHISPFPVAKEDLAFVVDESVSAEQLRAAVQEGLGELCEDVRVFDVYRGANIGEGRVSITVSVRLRAENDTLDAAQIAIARNAAIEHASFQCGAQLRAK
jgi:phenylalanyl-tRNA synthetase beta chain